MHDPPLACASSDVTPYIFEFFEKQTLQKLGYVFSGDDLDDEAVRIFCLIDAEIAKINREAVKRSSKRGK